MQDSGVTIVWVSVVLRRSVWDDNLSRNHLQIQVICVTSVDGINTLVIDVIGQLSVKPRCHWQRFDFLICFNSFTTQ